MKKTGQGSVSIIWGIGALLLFAGLLLFLVAFRENSTGMPALSQVELSISIVLMLFGLISFYMAHK